VAGSLLGGTDVWPDRLRRLGVTPRAVGVIVLAVLSLLGWSEVRDLFGPVAWTLGASDAVIGVLQFGTVTAALALMRALPWRQLPGPADPEFPPGPIDLRRGGNAAADGVEDPEQATGDPAPPRRSDVDAGRPSAALSSGRR